jgi:hypothetical protein
LAAVLFPVEGTGGLGGVSHQRGRRKQGGRSTPMPASPIRRSSGASPPPQPQRGPSGRSLGEDRGLPQWCAVGPCRRGVKDDQEVGGLRSARSWGPNPWWRDLEGMCLGVLGDTKWNANCPLGSIAARQPGSARRSRSRDQPPGRDVARRARHARSRLGGHQSSAEPLSTLTDAAIDRCAEQAELSRIGRSGSGSDRSCRAQDCY